MIKINKKFLTNFFNKLKDDIKKINSLENDISFLTEKEIKDRIKNLLNQNKFEKNLNQILHESFALTREASKRTLGLRHFDSQIIGGLILHKGKIAEMKTGEGKTLAATLALVLNALTLKGAQLITVNEYLAKRDKQTMSKLYHYLGLSVGLIEENMKWTERKKNHLADITYLTNSQLVFDYLRDNMALSTSDLILSNFNYCIIDEVDSILIDEARTPLIISKNTKTPVLKYVVAAEIINYLQSKIHYIFNEKTKNITLTNQGTRRIEKILNTNNLYNKNDPWIPFINNALKVKIFYNQNIDYIIQNNNIYIVDTFTGRIMFDRRWGDGLHEAVEAKEGIPIKKSSQTLSSITYQNFFLLYPKFAGMTGTGKTAELEFKNLYNLSVEIIPTNKKVIRKDLEDLVFFNEFTKWQEIGKKIIELNKLGQPVLIGTSNIKNSKIISQILKKKNVRHRLLNAKAKNLKFESEIIAEAGERYAVTVSTNMSGRGTDIILGGNSYYQSRKQIFIFLNEITRIKLKLLKENFINSLKELNLKTLLILLTAKELEKKIIFKKNFRLLKKKKISIIFFFKTLKILKFLNDKKIEKIFLNVIENNYYSEKKEIGLIIKMIYDHFYRKNNKNCKFEKASIKNLGGLYVIGTERHESKRIDNQLRGRSGRQGDPGTSQFFNSLDDNLLKIFGNSVFKKIFNEKNDIDLTVLNRSVEKIQKNVEDYYYDIRKNLLNYEQILNYQRFLIYYERKYILKKKLVQKEIMIFGENLMFQFAKELEQVRKNDNNEFAFRKLESEIYYLLNLSSNFYKSKKLRSFTSIEIYSILKKEFWLAHNLKRQEIETLKPNSIKLLEKKIFLNKIDQNWKNHLQKIGILKEVVSYRGYSQIQPLNEYKKEGFKLFLETIYQIQYNTIYTLLKLKIQK